MKIVLAPESIEDLARLREFIEINNPDAAKQVANSIVDGVSKFKKFPYIGVKVSTAPNQTLK